MPPLSDRNRTGFVPAALLVTGALVLYGSSAHAEGFYIGAGAGVDFF